MVLKVNQNLVAVFKKLNLFSKNLEKIKTKSAGIGPKEASLNPRQFTEEQLKEGQKIISLQYGTNKLANQSGINFGCTRHM